MQTPDQLTNELRSASRSLERCLCGSAVIMAYTPGCTFIDQGMARRPNESRASQPRRNQIMKKHLKQGGGKASPSLDCSRLSDTPETDANVKALTKAPDCYCESEFARTLERKLNAALKSLVRCVGWMDARLSEVEREDAINEAKAILDPENHCFK